MWPAGSDHVYDCLPRVAIELKIVLLLKDLYPSVTTKLCISILTSENIKRLRWFLIVRSAAAENEPDLSSVF